MATVRIVEVGRRLRAARALSGKTAGELARDAGVSKRTLYGLERGERLPDLLEAERLATATGQSVDFFLGTAFQEDEAPILPPPLPLVNGGGGK